MTVPFMTIPLWQNNSANIMDRTMEAYDNMLISFVQRYMY